MTFGYGDSSARIGSAIGGTAGSVLFIGTGGRIAQDNANFFWDDTNNTLKLKRDVIYGGGASQLEWRDSANVLGGKIDNIGYIEVNQGNPTISVNGLGVASFKMNETGAAQDWRFEVGRTGSGFFSLTNVTLGLTTPFVIDPATDYIGMGTASPLAKVHIDGTVRIDNQIGAAPNTSVGVAIANYYGTAATNFLGDPNAWLDIDLDGNIYKIPVYT